MSKFEDQFILLIADVYRQAALSNADMRAAADVLETLRAALIVQEDLFQVWNRLNGLIGQAQAGEYQTLLMQLRRQFVRLATDGEIRRLSARFERDPGAGWSAWLRSYVAALADWRVSFCLSLAEAPFTFPAELEYPAEQIRRFTRLIDHERWPEVYKWFLFLAGQDIPLEHKARMLVAAGEIYLFHLLKRDKAWELFERAKGLAPDDLWVIWAQCEYWLQQGRIDVAKENAWRAINLAPQEASGYIQLGDCYEKSGERDEAEEQYQRAVTSAPGDSEGYSRLMELYGRTEQFAAGEDNIKGLAGRILAVDPDKAYRILCTQGVIYKQNRLYESAYSYFARAIEMDPTRVGAYAYAGHAYLEEAGEAQLDGARREECYRQAEANFEKARDVAPEAADGYWGMSLLYERQERWDDTLTWCQRSLERLPEWEAIIRTRMGRVHAAQGRLGQAETELAQALDSEPDNQQALDALISVGDDYYKKKNDVEAALRVYETLRLRGGKAFEDDYWNRIGNLKYYYRDYGAAVDAYRQAIAADQQQAVYHSNLALALERRQLPGSRQEELAEAVGALGRAVELSPDEKEYAARLRKVERRHRLGAAYGESALKLTPVPTPVRVYLHSKLLPLILNESGDNLSADMFQKIGTMRAGIRSRFGLTVPGIRFTPLEGPSYTPGTYAYAFMDEPAVNYYNIPEGYLFLSAPPEKLAEIGIEAAKPGGEGVSGGWVSEAGWPKVIENGLELWPVSEYLVRDLQGVMELNLGLFMNHQEAVDLLAACGTEACAAVRDSHEKLTAFTRILRELLRNRTPIVALSVIAERFLELSDSGMAAGNIVERLAGLPELGRS